MLTLPGGRRSRTVLMLFGACVLVYSLNLREISSQDTIPTRVLPVALIEDHRLDLDRFFRDYPSGGPLPSWVQHVDGHYLSPYPVLPALLAVPIYLVPVSVLGGDSWVLVNILAKGSAALFAALAVVFVYLALGQLAGETVALGIALVYAFGTSTWSVSSQGLWGHGPAQLFLGAALYGVLRGEADPRFFGGAGLAAGLMVASRPQTALVGAALLAYVVHRDWRRGVRSAVLCAVALLPVLLYNRWAFGSVRGAYAQLTALHAEYDRVAGVWQTPLGEGLLGLLVSPSRGLFVYSPVLVVAFAGLVLSLRRHRGHFFHYLAGGLLATLLVLGKYSVWWGGHSFGPRYLTDLLPLLALGLVPAWEPLRRARPLRAVFLGLFVVSVLVQVIGVLYYPSPRDVDWNTSPRDVNLAPERLWDWTDSQLWRLLRNGPRPPGFGSIG